MRDAEEFKRTILSERDSLLVLSLLDNPLAPNARLKAAIAALPRKEQRLDDPVRSCLICQKEAHMGMFDILIVETPLPDVGVGEVRQWHTKDFPDPFMENYKITADGRLLHERIHYEDRSDPQYPIGSFERLVGSMTAIHDGWDDVHFHGILNFYGDKHSGEARVISFAHETLGKDLLHPKPAEWFEYNAKFTDGQLDEIVRAVRLGK